VVVMVTAHEVRVRLAIIVAKIFFMGFLLCSIILYCIVLLCEKCEKNPALQKSL